MTTAADLADALREALRTSTFPADDPNGLWRGDGTRAVRRLGMALEPPPDLGAQIRHHSLDAVWLHRPWRAADGRAGDVPIVAHHLSFDETLTPGFSPVIAHTFGLQSVVPFGEKEGRPLGMIGDVETRPLAAWIDTLQRAFGGYENLDDDVAGPALVRRVAFVGAFWPELVRAAAEREVDLYVTGQLRAPGREALRGTGMTALGLGHARCETWGMQKLAEIIRATYPDVEIVLLTP